MELQPLVDDFIRHISLERNLSSHTVDQYTRDLQHWSRFLVAQKTPLDINQITIRQIRGFVQHLAESGLAPRTVIRKLACLRSFYTFLCRYHDLKENPAAAVTAPRVPQRLPQVLTHTEVYKLMEACEESYFRLHRVRDRCIIALLACLGLRRQELMDLRLEDWNAQERILRVQSGKGDRERLLPLTDELVALGAAWLEVRPKTALPYLFLSRHGQKLTSAPLQRMLQRLADAAGLERKPHLHMLRHYAATAVVNNHSSGGIEQARRILGHLSPATVSIYAHLSVDDLRPVVSDTGALAGLAASVHSGEHQQFNPSTELAAKHLCEALDQMPENWQHTQVVRQWVVTEWTRHLVPEVERSLGFNETQVLLFARQTVDGLDLDTHVTVAEVGHLLLRRLDHPRGHRVEDVLEIGAELSRGVLAQSLQGEGVRKHELQRLNRILIGTRPEAGPLAVVSRITAVAAQLRLVRVDVPSGRIATEILNGLLCWERGLPPLVIPASGRHFWRVLLERHQGGDSGIGAAFCLARLSEILHECQRMLIRPRQQ